MWYKLGSGAHSHFRTDRTHQPCSMDMRQLIPQSEHSPENHKAPRWHLQACHSPGGLKSLVSGPLSTSVGISLLPLLWPRPTPPHLCLPGYRCNSSSYTCYTSRGRWWCRLSWPSGAHVWPPGSWRSSTPSAHRWPFPGEKWVCFRVGGGAFPLLSF